MPKIKMAICGPPHSGKTVFVGLLRSLVPHVQDLPRSETREELFSTFWEFYMKWKNLATCWADTGHPVESGLFRACAEYDHTRDFSGPYPLHETRTLMLAMGVVPEQTESLAVSGLDPATVKRHNPVDDCRISAACTLKLLAQAHWLREKA